MNKYALYIWLPQGRVYISICNDLVSLNPWPTNDSFNDKDLLYKNGAQTLANHIRKNNLYCTYPNSNIRSPYKKLHRRIRYFKIEEKKEKDE